MKIIKILLVLFGMFVLVFSCNKDNTINNNNTTDSNSNTNHYYISKVDSSLYSLLFNNGSYWIYQDDSLNIDSVSIIEIQYKIDALMPAGPGQGSSGEVQYYNVKYTSSMFEEHEEQIFEKNISLDKANGPYLYVASKQIGYENRGCKILNILDTLTVGGITFSDVVLVHSYAEYYNLHDRIHSVNLYFEDSVGIIKKEIIENNNIVSEWNLIRHNVDVLDSIDRNNL